MRRYFVAAKSKTFISSGCDVVKGCACSNNRCSYSRSYVEGSSIYGYYAKDMVGANAGCDFALTFPTVGDLPCNVRRRGGQSLVIGGESLVMLEGKACNPL